MVSEFTESYYSINKFNVTFKVIISFNNIWLIKKNLLTKLYSMQLDILSWKLFIFLKVLNACSNYFVQRLINHVTYYIRDRMGWAQVINIV